jgi:glyoxylase-like metal-dependent hydrolase (beta-lactamase superfamily II)
MSRSDARWAELGDGVLVRRYTELDLSIGLIVGEDACLVVDTRGDLVQGAELAAAVREVTPVPWTVVLTHAHWDHSFGTGAFLPAAVWAHEECVADLRREGAEQRERVAAMYIDLGRPADAAHVAEVEIVLPDQVLRDRAELTVGGRAVVLAHFGPGHTDNDIVVQVPDAGVVFAGDLVEQGAPPSFGDSYPLAWPAAVDGILGLAPEVISPGHGEPVDVGFVAAQQAELALVARLCTDVITGDSDRHTALRRSPYPAGVFDAALQRVKASHPEAAKSPSHQQHIAPNGR